jgi:hypothetical protein
MIRLIIKGGPTDHHGRSNRSSREAQLITKGGPTGHQGRPN